MWQFYSSLMLRGKSLTWQFTIESTVLFGVNFLISSCHVRYAPEKVHQQQKLLGNHSWSLAYDSLIGAVRQHPYGVQMRHPSIHTGREIASEDPPWTMRWNLNPK